MHNLKVKDFMTIDPIIIDPETSLQQAAETMKDIDCGMLPVGSKDRLRGVITDRDITLRAVCEGKHPMVEMVRDYMTSEVYACNEEDFLEDGVENYQCRSTEP